MHFIMIFMRKYDNINMKNKIFMCRITIVQRFADRYGMEGFYGYGIKTGGAY